MATLARLFNFLAGTPAVADEVDAEFDQLIAGHNAQEVAIANAVLPAGSLIATARSTAPTGYLLCDGAAVSRATYAALFSAIGTAYGAGDGSATFNLPDLRGRVPVGKGTHVDVDTLGDNESLAVGSRGPYHAHTTPAHNTGSAGGEQTGAPTGVGGGQATFPSGTGSNVTVANKDHVHDQPAHVHAEAAIGTDRQGPSFVVVNYLVKT